MRILRTRFATDASKALQVVRSSQISQAIQAAGVLRAAKKPPLKATSLRLLVSKIRKRHVEPPPGSAADSQTVTRKWGHDTAVKVIANLLRHARALWPSGLEDIAVLATELIGHRPVGTATLAPESVRKLSHLYNQLLSLIAEPVSFRTFQSVIHQQRAQFVVIRKMTTFNPHLPLTREGFRALAMVQLAHRKTQEERAWASSKALSWPPWKEQLLGIDADSEDTGKSSRTLGVLSRMTDAGYSHSEWEKAARILAGWDTDNSPTIQTRRFLAKAADFSTDQLRSEALPSKSIGDKTLWAARISATRTVKEAWACFVSYIESTDGRHSLAPYKAMFLRLIYAREEDVQRGNGQSSVVPGDGRETWPEPTSPHDFLYVSSDPPSIHQFWNMMREARFVPGKRLLSALLDSADTYSQGEMYLLADSRIHPRKKALMGMRNNSVQDIRIAAGMFGDRVTAAWVRLLCRVQVQSEKSFVLPDVPCRRSAGSRAIVITTDPFVYAQRVVTALRSTHRPVWYALFGGINRRITYYGDPQTASRLVLAWLDHLQDMDSLGADFSFEGFLVTAEILEALILLGCTFPDASELGYHDTGDSKLGWVALCKSMFHATAYGGSLKRQKSTTNSIEWLPLDRSSQKEILTDPIDVPPPAILHRTIRILGMCEDYQAILTLLRWMDVHAPKLAVVANELANSRKLYLRTMCAVRYFLEASWRDEDFEYRAAVRREWQPGQRKILEQAKGIIICHRHDWGGWPTDKDLHAYHEGNQPRARRLRKRLGLANVSFNG